MVVALAAAAVLIVLSLAALGASTAGSRSSVGAFLAGVALLGPFVLTRFDLYAAALTLAAVCAILYRRRDPRAGAARGRDRDEDLPCRAPAAARRADLAARGPRRGARGARR